MSVNTLGNPDSFAIEYEAPHFVERGLIWGHFSCLFGGKRIGDPQEDVCISALLTTVGTAIKDRTNRHDLTLFSASANKAFLYLQHLMWETPPPSEFPYPPPEIHAAFWLFDKSDAGSLPKTIAIDNETTTRILYSYDEGKTIEEAMVPSEIFYTVLRAFWHEIDRRWGKAPSPP